MLREPAGTLVNGVSTAARAEAQPIRQSRPPLRVFAQRWCEPSGSSRASSVSRDRRNVDLAAPSNTP
jgi:hypothetical protein